MKSKIAKSDKRILIDNFISLSSLQLVTLILPLLTLPYVLRVIGYDKYGVIAIAISLVTYFQSIVDYSFKVTGVREVVKSRDSKEKMSVIYSRIMTIKLLFLTLSLLIISSVVELYPPFREEREVFYYTTLSLVGFALFPDWFFQGIEKMSYIKIVNVLVRLIFAGSIFIFIKEEEDYELYPILNGIGLIIAALIGQFLVLHRCGIKLKLISVNSIKVQLRKNFPIFVNQFVPNLYNNSTIFILGIIVSTELLGIYAAIKKVIDICTNLLNVISRTFFPTINRNRDSFHTYKKIMFTLFFLGVFGLLLLNPFVFKYLNLTHSSALLILCIMSFSILGYVCYDVFGLNYFIVRNKDSLVMRNTLISSIVGFILSFILISQLELIGAALSLFLGRSLMGGGLLWHYYKETHVKKYSC